MVNNKDGMKLLDMDPRTPTRTRSRGEDTPAKSPERQRRTNSVPPTPGSEEKSFSRNNSSEIAPPLPPPPLASISDRSDVVLELPGSDPAYDPTEDAAVVSEIVSAAAGAANVAEDGSPLLQPPKSPGTVYSAIMSALPKALDSYRERRISRSRDTKTSARDEERVKGNASTVVNSSNATSTTGTVQASLRNPLDEGSSADGKMSSSVLVGGEHAHHSSSPRAAGLLASLAQADGEARRLAESTHAHAAPLRVREKVPVGMTVVNGGGGASSAEEDTVLDEVVSSALAMNEA